MDKHIVRMIWTGFWLVFFVIIFLWLMLKQDYWSGMVILAIAVLCGVGELLLFRAHGKAEGM
jgi:hypothetical protein